MHRNVVENSKTRREAAVSKHNAKTNAMSGRFSIGYHVLFAKRIVNFIHMLRRQWLGLQRIARIELDWIY